MTSGAKRRLFWSAVIFGSCTSIALLSAVGGYVCDLGSDQPFAWRPLLRQELKDWYACGLLCVCVIGVASRNPLEPGRSRRWLVTHFLVGLLLSAICALLTAWWVTGERSVMHPERTLSFGYLLRMEGIHYLILNLIVYWFMVFAHAGLTHYQKSRERERLTASLQRELVEARLETLRMQLNPHFLFNTLHAISSLIHEDPDAADRMVARLSDLLRLTLDQSKPQEVSLNEELAFLDRYLEIELTRFADRLTIEKQIDPGTLDALVPYLILQPLVENAIRHGIEPREELGHLAISARRTDGKLELRVKDDGAGLAMAASKPREGIGLSNTRSRLRHLYGEDFRFELVEACGGGLEARVEIPYHLKPANGH